MLERRPPRRDAALFRSTEQLLGIPLAPEGGDDPLGCPTVLIRAEDAASQPSLLQVLATLSVDMPAQRRGFLGTTDLDDHEARQVFAPESLLDAVFEALAVTPPGRGESLPLRELARRLAECRRDAALLALEQLLALNDHQRPIEFAHRSAQSRCADLRELPGELLHPATACCEQERGLAGAVAQRQRDEAVVPDEIQVQLELRAPESTIADQRAGRWPCAALACVERIVQLAQSLQTRLQYLLVGAVPRIAAVQERDVSGFADEHP